jgi:excisionase family DNA binding protein
LFADGGRPFEIEEAVRMVPDKRKRHRKRQPIERVCVTIEEFMSATGFSRATVYRMMNAGKLRYAALSGRMRRIPVSEYARLGLSGDVSGASAEVAA